MATSIFSHFHAGGAISQELGAAGNGVPEVLILRNQSEPSWTLCVTVGVTASK